MFRRTIYKLLESRHFWRYASFSEVAELYTSRTLRVIGLNIASGFASVYLYQTGYSLSLIMLFWLCYYISNVIMNYFSAHIIGYFGPKHGTLFSNLIYIPAMVALGLVPNYGFRAIIVWGVLASLSACLYQLSYLVEFSKVKSVDHAGREIGFMNILEKVSIGMSPVIGGLIALFFGAQAVMMIGAVIFALSAMPLLRTVEQTRVRQHIRFRELSYRVFFHGFISQIGVGVDVVATGTVWSLFIASVIFPNLSNAIYVSLGALSSVTILAAVGVSYAYGKLIDRNRGGDLLKISVMVNALVHASRPFANGIASIVGTNVTNEIATTGITMSYMRGTFDTADLSGHRIAYLSIMQIFASFGAIIACVALLVCLSMFGDAGGLRAFFFIAAAGVLLTGTAHFHLYKK
jgi:MFS family permease